MASSQALFSFPHRQKPVRVDLVQLQVTTFQGTLVSLDGVCRGVLNTHAVMPFNQALVRNKDTSTNSKGNEQSTTPCRDFELSNNSMYHVETLAY